MLKVIKLLLSRIKLKSLSTYSMKKFLSKDDKKLILYLYNGLNLWNTPVHMLTV